MKTILKFIVFCLVGGTAALIDLLFFNLFFFVYSNFILSRILSISIAIIYNFFMNRNITFSAKRYSLKKQIFKYIFVYILAGIINLLVGITLINLFGEGVVQANIAAVAGIIISIPFSFFGSLLWVFKNERNIENDCNYN